jgi:ubiquinol-cytochrome c reductase cytochrome b subunit
VVVPTIIFLILFAVPYIDPGPSRLAKNRKLGVSIGILITITIVVLTFMGTGVWGVAAPPPVELVQEFLPEEGVGPVREIGYEGLLVGSYDVNDPSTYPSGKLGDVLGEMEEAVVRESNQSNNNFFDGDINVTINDWQTDLKQLVVTITWLEIPEGSTDNVAVERSHEAVFYIHRESNYELLE